MEMIKNREDYFVITPIGAGRDGKGVVIKVDYGYNYHSTDTKNNMVSCYIPSLDLYFYSDSNENKQEIAGHAGEAFISSWINDEGFTSFIRKLKSLGYEPTNGVLDWAKIRKKILSHPITFKHIHVKHEVPDFFVDANIGKISREFELAY